MSFVYAVLFSDGRVKPGRSSDVVSRINTHIATGRGFGVEVRCFFIAHVGEGCAEAEERLISMCKSNFEHVKGEYFERGCYEIIRSYFISKFNNFACGSKIKRDRDGFPCISVYFPALDGRMFNGVTLKTKNKVFEFISKKGDLGATLAIIRNRYRKNTSEAIASCDELLREGRITVKEHLHPKCGYVITTYYAVI